ncbi:CGNR zinc finger domain-containing protein [Nocardioides taihuensis]|uniref:CGNR zinc finger domain-containing protein n=1 Tax=Nocardioides taihuensis TaxID=1835606 RepID=A0ABW0BF27_9ACTN
MVRYAEGAASLVNADLGDRDRLAAHLGGREWLSERCSDRDAFLLRKLQRELRPVFDTAAAGDGEGVVRALNGLLEQYPVTPRISGHDEHLHLHVGSTAEGVADLLVGEALLGLATLVCDLGPRRLGVCSAKGCRNVFVDISPNASRRYCSDRCSSRANVAAYRARQRAGSPA